MKTNKSPYLIFVLAAGIAILAGCNKQPVTRIDPVPIPVPAAKKLWKIKSGEHDSTLLAYTTAGELLKVISTKGGPGTEPLTYTFMYDASSRVTTIYSNTDLTYKFVYEAGQLKLTENYAGSKKVSENYFQYVSNKLSSTTMFKAYPKENGVVTYLPVLETKYTYDVTGHLKKASSYTIDNKTHVLTPVGQKEISQYDNSSNPLSVIRSLTMVSLYEIPGEHNTLREIVYGSDGFLEETTVNHYVYDANDYPVSGISTVTPEGSNPVTKAFAYYYK